MKYRRPGCLNSRFCMGWAGRMIRPVEASTNSNYANNNNFTNSNSRPNFQGKFSVFECVFLCFLSLIVFGENCFFFVSVLFDVFLIVLEKQ